MAAVGTHLGSALYMSEAFATAGAQYEQDLGIRLGTLCAYDVDADGIADLNDLVTVRAIGVEPADLECPWKQIALVDKK